MAKSIKISEKISTVKELISKWKKYGASIGFVPTMGFLHEGHQSLITKSVSENDMTVVSVFVNPTQFAPNEDFDSYPKNFFSDILLCQSSGVDLVFRPSPEEMYPNNFRTFVDMDSVTKGLCGKSRPTHFRGVCTVVNKLLNITTPTRAYFGQKDAQQLAVIKRMVRDLDIDTEVIGCPIIRETDGLAKSSRNAYLNPEERKAALVVSKAVFEGERLVKFGERNAEKIITAMENIIAAEPMARIDYVEIVGAESIEKITVLEGQVLAAVAVFIGKTRLIDNFICEV